MSHQIKELQPDSKKGMQHLVMELYGCDAGVLTDRTALEQFLTRVIATLDMQQVSPVAIYDITTSDPQDDGLSGFVVIATSHIAFHAWPLYRALSADVYSCESFDEQAVVALFTEFFQGRESEIYLVRRGERFPRIAKHTAVV